VEPVGRVDWVQLTQVATFGLVVRCGEGLLSGRMTRPRRAKLANYEHKKWPRRENWYSRMLWLHVSRSAQNVTRVKKQDTLQYTVNLPGQPDETGIAGQRGVSWRRLPEQHFVTWQAINLVSIGGLISCRWICGCK